jgi:hypothetical protein
MYEKKVQFFKVLVIMGETANFVSVDRLNTSPIVTTVLSYIPSSYISNFSPLHSLLLLGHQFPLIHSDTIPPNLYL